MLNCSREVKLRLKKIERPARNRFFDLPGELRNTIYELSIGRSVQTRLPPEYPRSDWRKWMGPEPSLLRVSKAIRAEAGSIHYSGTVFEIYFKSNECEQACAFAMQKLQLWIPRLRIHARLHFTSIMWKDIGAWIFLAKLIFNVDLAWPSRTRFRLAWRRIITTSSNPGIWYGSSNLRKSLCELIDFSVEYRMKGMSEADLETHFLGWASKIIEQPARIPNAKTRDAVALSLRKVAMTTRTRNNFVKRLAKEEEDLTRMTYGVYPLPTTKRPR